MMPNCRVSERLFSDTRFRFFEAETDAGVRRNGPGAVGDDGRAGRFRFRGVGTDRISLSVAIYRRRACGKRNLPIIPCRDRCWDGRCRCARIRACRTPEFVRFGSASVDVSLFLSVFSFCPLSLAIVDCAEVAFALTAVGNRGRNMRLRQCIPVHGRDTVAILSLIGVKRMPGYPDYYFCRNESSAVRSAYMRSGNSNR